MKPEPPAPGQSASPHINPRAGAPIELSIKDTNQLFQSLDPHPFRERDLDPAVEEFVVDWALELPRNAPIQLVVHLPAAEAARPRAAEIDEAIRGYFLYRAEMTQLQLRELIRQGRTALAIGIAVLGVCVRLGSALSPLFGQGYAARFFNEGLIIVGWVANWRPLQIFLYDWWPYVRRRRLYLRLASARIDLAPF